MKRAYILITLVLMTGVTMSQGSKVLNAYSYMQDGEFLKAKAEIDPATEHEKTMAQAKTWYYRGQIYEGIYINSYAQTEEGASMYPEYVKARPGALLTAANSYEKALEMGSKRINMNEVDARYTRLAEMCFSEGVNQYNLKDYNEAIKYFQKCYDIKAKGGAVDTLALYNIALSSEEAGNLEKAAETYRKCIDYGYRLQRSYPDLANVYSKMGKEDEMISTLAEGRKKLPNNQELLTSEINIYLKKEQFDQALENLNLAIGNDPKNKILFYARGTIYNNRYTAQDKAGEAAAATESFNSAEADYKKAIELDDEYFEAFYNLGALYFNRGAELVNAANMITDNTKYKAAKAKADEEIKKALPPLERAHELNPADVSTMQSLKELYVRTNQMDKYNAMNEKLKN